MKGMSYYEGSIYKYDEKKTRKTFLFTLPLETVMYKHRKRKVCLTQIMWSYLCIFFQKSQNYNTQIRICLD